MSIMSDGEIAERCQGDTPMIAPFIPDSVKVMMNYPIVGSESGRKILSFGLSSYGYDVRLTEEVKIFTNVHGVTLDPKRFDEDCYITAKIHTDADGAKYALLPPNSFLLGSTKEWFNIPRDVLVVCLGKSTYARIGAVVNVTPLEPEWEGNVVVEISNTTTLPMKIYVGEGVAQFLFYKADRVCKTSYKDRGGKYQGQRGITPAKV